MFSFVTRAAAFGAAAMLLSACEVNTPAPIVAAPAPAPATVYVAPAPAPSSTVVVRPQ